MHRALTSFTATVAAAAFLSAGCAAQTQAATTPRDASNTSNASSPAGTSADGAPAPLPVDADAQPPSHHVRDEAHGSDALPRAMGWFSLAFGASAGVVAVGTSILMLHQHDLRNSECTAAKVCSQDGLNANEQLNGLAGWNVASYITAAAGIGIGAILLITNPKKDKRETALEVSPANSGAALQLRGTF